MHIVDRKKEPSEQASAEIGEAFTHTYVLSRAASRHSYASIPFAEIGR